MIPQIEATYCEPYAIGRAFSVNFHPPAPQRRTFSVPPRPRRVDRYSNAIRQLSRVG
jgi:hypothetical protein